MAISRKSMKDRLRERQETDYANRKGGGGRLFKNDLKGVEFWTCNEGDHIIDVVPYEVGENDPSLKPGDITYKLEIFVHSDVGQTEGHTICLNKTWGEKCPVCEEWKRLKDRGDIDDETLKALAPKRYPRVIYNIICYDNDEEVKKGVQVWHTSSYLMQTYLLELAKKPQRAGKGMSATTSIVFSDPDEGRSISFKRTGKKEDTKFVGIAFEPREYQLSDEDLEKAHCLDDLIARPTYDDVYEDFWGFRPGEEDTRTTRRPKEEPEPERPPRSRRPEPEPEPEPERPPRSRRPEPEPEDDVPEPEPEPEKEERKERPKASKSKGENLCPHGHEFGVDLDESPDCDDCSSWKDCAKENDRMEREERE